MSVSRYRPFDYDTFAAWMSEIGFTEAARRKDTWEYVWERPVSNGRFPGRFMVRIYSSVSYHNKMSRDVGGDAVRVLLFDTVTNKPIVTFPRVYRTENCKQNTIARAREAYGYVLDSENFCNCGNGLMVVREVRETGKQFLGCSSYPTCKQTRPLKEAVAA